MAEARQHYPDFDITRSWALEPSMALAGESFLDYLRRIGFSSAQIRYVERAWANATAETLANISAIGALEDVGVFPPAGHPDLPSAGEGDYRVVEGYDRLIDYLARGLDIRLNTPVSEIHWDEQQPIRVVTRDGAAFEADKVLITLPLGVLKSDQVCFSPELPAWKRAAIQALTMGVGMKIVFKFPAPIMPAGTQAIYADGNPPMWWTMQPYAAGEQVWTTLATGNWARELLEHDEQGAAEQALATLRRELGRPELEPLDVQVVNWTADEYALGAYSVLPPGAEGMREVLADPIGDRVFWAGEATAPQPWASTVHGAYVTGQRAAREIIASSS